MLTSGDTLTFSNDVVDASGKAIGAVDGTCVHTRKGRFDQANVTCQATVTLPNGQLFVSVVGEQNAKDTFKLFIRK